MELKIERTAEILEESMELSETELEAVAGGFFDVTHIALAQVNVNVGPSLGTYQSNAAAIIVH